MERSGKGLLVGGVVLVAVLLVSIGIFIYNGGFGIVNNSMSTYSTDQIQAYNAQFELFIGDKNGNTLSNLMTKLISVANQNIDEPSRIPAVTIANQINKSNDKISSVAIPLNEVDVQNYVKTISSIKKKIEASHNYKIAVNYGTNGLINEFIISY